MKKFTAELIGTFILVFVGTGSVVFGNGTKGLGQLGIALAFGLAIVAAAYSIGTISGAHLNPAVSVAMYVNKRMDAKELLNYIIAQVVGAILASASLFFLAKNAGLSTSSLGENAFSTVNAAGAFLFELIASFIFILVIVTVTSETKGNAKLAGLIIGLTLSAMILVGLNITGLSVNPARSLAPALFVGGKALSQLWVFIFAPIIGGILAALVGKNLLGTEE
ncbi:MIP family channel protein [Streptococcus urinalis FB127-CNA-2]|uniref:MIP family channel protein n=1 Tax=Streptococcus urinalis 2285-97 TaxID=764291 RepID=G5KE93_9STRE|nr:MIP family channel protein [Streptococcus urinalis]EHJ56262.1 MIP family channel protein [Streptococcus urinalis 2285-97]EKS18256.1 MIP family channel protein [Streptococcus urinalis FB127-CNA-2]VEF32870.1 aquaporin Z-water channel protein [Streptococcus urinalis]